MNSANSTSDPPPVIQPGTLTATIKINKLKSITQNGITRGRNSTFSPINTVSYGCKDDFLKIEEYIKSISEKCQKDELEVTQTVSEKCFDSVYEINDKGVLIEKPCDRINPISIKVICVGDTCSDSKYKIETKKMILDSIYLVVIYQALWKLTMIVMTMLCFALEH
jgi:hypothetical protein